MSVNSIQLLDDQKFFKLCSDAGLKIVEKGQFFITLDGEIGPNEMNNLCRENTVLRNGKASQAKWQILGNRKIGPVLDVQGLSLIKNVTVGNSFMGSNRERNQQICNRNVRKPFLLRMLSTELQGDLFRKRDHD